MAVARANRHAVAVAEKATVINGDVIGPHAKKEAGFFVVIGRTADKARIRTTGTRVQTVAAITIKSTVDNLHVAAHLKPEPLAVIVALADVGYLNVSASRKVDGAAATAPHTFFLRRTVALQVHIAQGDLLRIVREDQRVDRRQAGRVFGAVVGLNAVVEPDPVALDPGNGGKGLVKAAVRAPVVQRNGHTDF